MAFHDFYSLHSILWDGQAWNLCGISAFKSPSCFGEVPICMSDKGNLDKEDIPSGYKLMDMTWMSDLDLANLVFNDGSLSKGCKGGGMVIIYPQC